jgi:hypothetical protein
MTTLEDPGTSVRTITAEIDGRQVTVRDGTTIYDAARQAGVDIPVLCHNDATTRSASAGCASSTPVGARSPRPACGRARTG